MRRSLLLSIAAFTVLTVSTLGTFGGDIASAARRGANYFSNLPVVTHEGKTLRFYDDLIKGKIVVINFIYTSCPDLCSLSTARMMYVRKQLGELVGRDVFIYSISLDPENDSPDVLKEYAGAFDIGAGWLFLTGKPKDIHLIRWQLGERSRTLSEHRPHMQVGNDRTGEWRRMSVMGSLKLVTQSRGCLGTSQAKQERCHLRVHGLTFGSIFFGSQGPLEEGQRLFISVGGERPLPG